MTRSWVWVPIPFTLQVWLNSFIRQQFGRQAFGVSVQRSSAAPSPGLYTHYYYDRHSVWLNFPGNAHDTVDKISPPIVPQNRQTVICSAATPPRLTSARVVCDKASRFIQWRGNLREEMPLRENILGWLLFVGMKLRLNVLKIHWTKSCIFSP